MNWEIVLQIKLEGIDDPETVMQTVEDRLNAGEWLDVCKVFSVRPISEKGPEGPTEYVALRGLIELAGETTGKKWLERLLKKFEQYEEHEVRKTMGAVAEALRENCKKTINPSVGDLNGVKVVATGEVVGQVQNWEPGSPRSKCYELGKRVATDPKTIAERAKGLRTRISMGAKVKEEACGECKDANVEALRRRLYEAGHHGRDIVITEAEMNLIISSVVAETGNWWWFEPSTKLDAMKAGIFGWLKNTPSGKPSRVIVPELER